MTADWANSPRGRRELLIVGLFCLLSAAVPLFTTELYPFSRAPMFADAPQQYCDYLVFGPDGKQITDGATITKLGLQRNYWGNPLGVGVGFQPAPSVDRFGEVASEEAVAAEVTPRLAQFPDLAYIEVEQQVVGPVDDRHVGVDPTRTRRQRIQNPSYKGGGA